MRRVRLQTRHPGSTERFESETDAAVQACRWACAVEDESWIAAFLAYVIQFDGGVVVCGLN